MYSVKPQCVIRCRGRVSFHRQNVKQLLKRLVSKHDVAFGAECIAVSGKPDAWSIRKQRTFLDVAMEVGDTIFSAIFFDISRNVEAIGMSKKQHAKMYISKITNTVNYSTVTSAW